MYARSTTIRGNPEKMDEGIAYVRDKVMPALTQMDGCVGLSLMCDRDSGRAIATSAWADREALRMSRETVSGIRERAAERFGGTPEVQEWEIALLHRMQEAPEGACCRVIWTQGDPARMDDIVEGFRMAVVPRVDDLPGFCSMSVLVDREGGRCVVASTYENRTSMERATDQAMAMRDQFTRQMDMEILEVEPFELVLAHLRVPETV